MPCAPGKRCKPGSPIPLASLVTADPELLAYLPAASISELLDASQHLGDAPQRARRLAQALRQAVIVTEK
jgi:adenylosuccinate lyase